MNYSSNIIIPFCIYHYIDPDTHTYMGYIGNPTKKMLKDGTEIFKCDPAPRIYKKWFLADNFYAISASFRPIPVGMRIFCAKKTGGYPYATKEIIDVYDTYNIKNDCVYFTTYTQPVPNTKRLYFHVIENTVFPSFDSNPPSNDPEWGHSELSPIFVMTPSTVGKNPNNIKFKCVNGKCLPWKSDISDMYEVNKNNNLMEINHCVLLCSELIRSNNKTIPQDITEMINSSTKRKSTVTRFFKKIKPPVIGISITVLVLLLFIILYTILKNENEKLVKHTRV